MERNLWKTWKAGFLVAAYCFAFVLVLMGGSVSFVNKLPWRVYIQKYYLPFIFLSLLSFAGLHSPGVDRDSLEYVAWFNQVASGNLTALDWIKDPAFVLILHLTAFFSTSYVVAQLTIVVAILLSQYFFALKISTGRWLPLLLYLIFCRFFIVQEMTQIRAGVAIPLMSLSILLASESKNRAACLCFIVATCFHLSALIGLPIFILTIAGIRFASRMWIFMLAPIGIIGSFLLRPLWELLEQFSRTIDYLNGTQNAGDLRLLSLYFIARVIVISFVLLFLWRKSSSTDKVIAFCSAFGLFIEVVLSSNDALALRGSEIFGLFDMAMFAIPLSHLKQESLALYALFIIILGAILFSSSLKVIGPYQWVLG